MTPPLQTTLSTSKRGDFWRWQSINICGVLNGSGAFKKRWLVVGFSRQSNGCCRGRLSPPDFRRYTAFVGKKQEEVEGVQRSDFSANLPPWQKRQIHGRKAQVNECIIVEHRASK